jgi:hypothetical protein
VVTPYSVPLDFGRVLGDDSRFYTFHATDCLDEAPPMRAGVRVAFEPASARARRLHVVPVESTLNRP